MKASRPPSSLALVSDRRRTRDYPYSSEPQTKQLLDVGLQFCRERIQASDMISVGDAAKLLGTGRAAINAWIKSGRSIGVPDPARGFRLPSWQFNPVIWAVLQTLAEHLATGDGSQLLSFLESPEPALRGQVASVCIGARNADRARFVVGKRCSSLNRKTFPLVFECAIAYSTNAPPEIRSSWLRATGHSLVITLGRSR